MSEDSIAGNAVTVLSEKQMNRVDESLSRATDWLSEQQLASGAFPTDPSGQPGVTSLCLLAYMAQGHRPGEGKFGKQVDLALSYVLDKGVGHCKFSVYGWSAGHYGLLIRHKNGELLLPLVIVK